MIEVIFVLKKFKPGFIKFDKIASDITRKFIITIDSTENWKVEFW